MECNNALRKVYHKTDICVVGGGLSGMLTAISAARHGAKVVLINDRPVLGGNASSEIRMWALGAHGENNRETGIFEEILIENMRRNPTKVFPIWDSILYEKVKNEENIELLLNCSVADLEMDANKIKSVTGWQLTTYTWHTVEATYFADCSGDSILAPMSGAKYRVGREASSEFNEDIAPEVSDKKTMGLSCLIQARETDHPVKFTPPEWAYKYEDESEFAHRGHNIYVPNFNYWWIELGGEQDTIHDTEEIRDELLKVSFGVWDHIKNHGDHNAENWELEFLGFLPGKRESRRYIGDYILTQNDVRAEGKFEDLIAYGGWSMDDHNPGGFNYKGEPTIYHPAPSPFGIPYRCLYSENIENLTFAGRNISTTHTAMSSSRVMATCAILGQALGTALSIAVRDKVMPKDIYPTRIKELQQMLINDDCYLPFNKKDISDICMSASLSCDCENADNLRNGLDRPIGDEDNGIYAPIGSTITYNLKTPAKVSNIRIIFDSDLNRTSVSGNEKLRRYPMICNKFMGMEPFGFPTTMVKSFTLSYEDENGNWHTLLEDNDHYQRLVTVKPDVVAKSISLTVNETHGSEEAHIFSFDFE